MSWDEKWAYAFNPKQMLVDFGTGLIIKKGVDWIGGRLSFKAKGMEVEVPNRSLLSEVDDVAAGITESAERVVKENADDVVETVMERGSGAEELKISARNTSRGNPNAINHFDADLNTRQQNLLNQLPDYDSSVIVKKSDVNLNDLSALTAKTGDEFAMFTRGSQRLIVRGGSTKVNINSVRAQELLDAGYKWSGHTHPGTDFNVKMPSPGDKGILNIFKQEQSVIYDSKGRFELFGGN